jgi:multiple sugar transport system ATP-binding protein
VGAAHRTTKRPDEGGEPSCIDARETGDVRRSPHHFATSQKRGLTPAMATIEFDNVSKRFEGNVAVDDLNLTVQDGELLVLLGPSGCGKSTVLRMVAGLDEPDEGLIKINGEVVNDVEPRDRDVAMVFQSYALYPHLTVEGNLEFPLRRRRVEQHERLKIVSEVAEILQLSPLLKRKPAELSGGQRQRVALGRAIVRKPSVFLMDEPLSNLDAALRVETRAQIVALQRRLLTTTMYVTHDQVEAMTMGDRIAVMKAGVLQQLATPKILYSLPANVFVAGFLGNPPMNLIPGKVASTGASRMVCLAGSQLALPPAYGRADLPEEVITGIRPEDLTIGSDGALSAVTTIAEVLGSEVHVIAALPDGSRLIVRQDADLPVPNRDEPIKIRAERPEAVLLFDATTGERIQTL